MNPSVSIRPRCRRQSPRLRRTTRPRPPRLASRGVSSQASRLIRFPNARLSGDDSDDRGGDLFAGSWQAPSDAFAYGREISADDLSALDLFGAQCPPPAPLCCPRFPQSSEDLRVVAWQYESRPRVTTARRQRPGRPSTQPRARSSCSRAVTATIPSPSARSPDGGRGRVGYGGGTRCDGCRAARDRLCTSLAPRPPSFLGETARVPQSPPYPTRPRPPQRSARDSRRDG